MNSKTMKIFIYALMILCLGACGSSTNRINLDTPVESPSEEVKSSAEKDKDIELINTVYEKFVFAIDADESIVPEKYFTANALKKLQEDYEFDCEDGPCYAFYALRTGMQDSKPGSDEASMVYGIDSDGDGWYIVTYSDMGWPGKTRIKITDGKVDDYQQLNQ